MEEAASTFEDEGIELGLSKRTRSSPMLPDLNSPGQLSCQRVYECLKELLTGFAFGNDHVTSLKYVLQLLQL